jgi:hypothetical protein
MILRRGCSAIARGCRRRFHQLPQLHAGRGEPPRRGCAASSAPQPLVAVAPSEASLQHLAELLASVAQQGDCICLYGRVGAGKSVFR